MAYTNDLDLFEHPLLHVAALALRQQTRDQVVDLLIAKGCDPVVAPRLADIAAEVRAKADRPPPPVRLVGLGVLVFGLLMLGCAYYLTTKQIPAARYGRLVVGFLVGGASAITGIWLILTGGER
ncbi:hypothetical protein [Mesorhizobium sp. B2-7-1]|uniref:hypothetical protein n=1 Tax=Mesorhizobium sp. B2-7-1 TaxID=2589909 RepID=UPI001127FE69|nr:hypothetical protein [Mesorhizobium sp. B2-7-1]TPJ44457.1 hypothetical protein FJ471_32885 [Mesorhizobium sp. B2-7-1]